MNKRTQQRKRRTRQLAAVRKVVSESTDHPTADLVYERVRQAVPTISLGTVYRNLEKLKTAGELRVVHTLGAQRHYDKRTDNHCHVECTSCGAVADLDLDSLDLLPGARDAKASTDFEIHAWHVSAAGLCPACNKKRRDGDKPQTQAVTTRSSRNER